MRQHVSSKVNTLLMYCFPYSTVSPTTWSVVTHAHGSRGVFIRCILKQGHVLTHSLHHKPGQGRTTLNICDVISALGDVDLCVEQVLRNAGAFEVPFAHALPPRLQLRRLPKVSSNYKTILCNSFWMTRVCAESADLSGTLFRHTTPYPCVSTSSTGFPYIQNIVCNISHG